MILKAKPIVEHRAFRSYCKSNKITHKELASVFNVTETTIRNIISGKTKMSEEFMVKAAQYLNADVFELFPESPLLKHIKERSKKKSS
jgi:transcriptional regulator with XRE-family HTH domain